jgi:YidC/Oxa1 family membrane protein insertase
MSGFLNEQGQGQQKNMFLAILLALGVILVWQSFMVPPPPPPAESAGVEGSAAGAPESATPAAAAPAAPAGEAGVDVVPEAPVLPSMVLRGANHDVSISNVGGRFDAVTIREPEQYQPRDSIIGVFPADGEAHLPGTLQIAGLPDLRETSTYAVVEEETERNAADGTFRRIALRWTSPDRTIEVTRRYEVDARAFGLLTSVEVRNLSAAPRRFESLSAGVYGEFSQKGGGMFGQAASVLEGICVGPFGTERRPARKIDEVREFGVGDEQVEFAGIDEQYFMTALIPDSGTVVDRCRWEPVDESHVVTRLETADFTVEPGASARFDFVAYTGPKHDEYLAAFPGGLGRSVDFGLFSFLALPIRWLLLLFQGWVVNWGLAIIVLTIVIKLLLFPVTQKGYTSMEKMKRVQPKLSVLQKKYENDRMKLAEEQMKLFKDEGVSPMGGCLPMIAQMPIYFALYRTIWGSAELYNAPFFGWVKDLSQPDPFFILPIAMGATMVIQQRLMPQAVDNPQMQMVNKIMPIMFTAMMLFLPSGLVLYIFVNMVLSIFQMLYIKRQHDTPDAAEASR